MKAIVLIFILFVEVKCFCQDSPIYLKVHFLYGSKPKKAFKKVEPKWFGGVMGGHVGIEIDSNKILNFVPNGKFHVFANRNDRHSKYTIHSLINFYEILGGDANAVKKTIFYLPITVTQKSKIDSLAKVYLNRPPYDYALFGMRCASACYDILAQLGFFRNYSYGRMYKKIFYPKKLRKRLFKLSNKKNWVVVKEEGSQTRKWEKD